MTTFKFSNSEIQTFKECRRKWWLTYYRRLGLTAQRQTGPRMIGTRIHVALASMYPPPGVAPEDPCFTLATLISHDRRLVPEKELKEFDSEAELQKKMLEGYLEWVDESGCDADLEVISAETYLESPIFIPSHPDFNIWIMGKLDIRYKRLSDGTRLLGDYKTTDSFMRLTRDVRQNEQMLHYLTLERLQENPEDGFCTGVLYTMMRKVKRTVRAKPPFFERVEIRHNGDEIRNYIRRIQGEISDILATRDRLGAGADHHAVAYPRPNTDCSWKCDFYTVCPMFDNGSRAEDFLNTYYTEVDPHAHYGAR